MSYLLQTTAFCIFLTTLSCAQKDSLKSEMQGFESRVDSLLQIHHAAGLSVAIIKNGETAYAKGFGFRDYDKKLPVDEHTIFGIGSCTKAFTAATLGILKGEGKLNFTDKPSKYIPGLSFLTKAMNDSIQIEHLLTHSTGIGNRSSESTAILFTNDNARELVQRIEYLKPSAGVGELLMYNNLMYTLAGMVGEGVTGEGWAENIQHKLFDPIGMSRTFSDVAPAAEQANYSFGYAVDSITPSKVFPEDMSTRAPAGAIFSTANDMSMWINTWLNNGKVAGRQLLPESYVSEAISEKIPWPLNPNDTITRIPNHYGYGWLTWLDKGYRRIEHSGGVSGYGSNIVFFPDENIGVIVLTNQTASSLAYSVADEIISRLLPKIENTVREVQFSQIQNILPADTPTAINSERPPTHDLEAFEGTYYHPGFGIVTVTMQGETLYADFPMTKMRLTHHENNVFYDHYTEEVPIVMWNFMNLDFRVGDAGNIDRLMINLDSEPVVFQKKS